MNRIKELEKKLTPVKELPKFAAGDTITVSYKIIEGTKERIQEFTGVVIQRRGTGTTETFTVRKISGGVGVERIFPIFSPMIDSIEVTKKAQARRSKLYYVRDKAVKDIRRKMKSQVVRKVKSGTTTAEIAETAVEAEE